LKSCVERYHYRCNSVLWRSAGDGLQNDAFSVLPNTRTLHAFLGTFSKFLVLLCKIQGKAYLGSRSSIPCLPRYYRPSLLASFPIPSCSHRYRNNHQVKLQEQQVPYSLILHSAPFPSSHAPALRHPNPSFSVCLSSLSFPFPLHPPA
jgi:hypothetical protein